MTRCNMPQTRNQFHLHSTTYYRLSIQGSCNLRHHYHATPTQHVGVIPKAKASRVVKGESPSSTKWLRRQLTDEFVKKAHDEGYLSRAAYKLIWIDEKHDHFLKPGKLIIDLGAAPGGWTQVALQRVKNTEGKKDGVVISVDLQDLPNLGSVNIKGDFTEAETKAKIRETLHGKQADVILSDMAPSATGHRDMDHLRLIVLNEDVMAFAEEVLKKDGTLVMKTSRGGSEKEILAKLKSEFKQAKYCKPDASRKDSSEIFLVATGFQKDKLKKEVNPSTKAPSKEEEN